MFIPWNSFLSIGRDSWKNKRILWTQHVNIHITCTREGWSDFGKIWTAFCLYNLVYEHCLVQKWAKIEPFWPNHTYFNNSISLYSFFNTQSPILRVVFTISDVCRSSNLSSRPSLISLCSSLSVDVVWSIVS